MSIIDKLARKRMTESGESYAAAVQAVLGVTDPWLDERLIDVPVDSVVAAELRQQPKALHPLILAFPPFAVVCGSDYTRPVSVARWTLHPMMVVVTSEGRHPHPIEVHVEPFNLEVIAYARGWTPDRVRDVLGIIKP